MTMDSTIFQHIRYIYCSQTLRDAIIAGGFVEEASDSIGMGLKQVRRFTKGNLRIEDSYYNGIVLIAYEDIGTTTGPKARNKPKREKVIKYKGLSVNKELLENFMRKGIYNK